MSEVPPAMRWTERVSASNKVVRKEAVVLWLETNEAMRFRLISP
jgi:hypothetical protein